MKEKTKLHIERKNKFVCSQFVAHIISESGVTLSKPVWMYSPEDLRHLPGTHLVYRGELNDFYNNYLISSEKPEFKMPV